MKLTKKFFVKLIIFLLGVAIGAGAYAGYDLVFSDTSIVSNGNTKIWDHRDFAERELSSTKIADGLDDPWAFAFLPNGDILITERFGSLRIIQDGSLLEESISGVPDVFSSGQGGLLDVIIHPNFAENNLIYLSYAHGTEEANRLRVARARLNNLRLEDLEIIFETNQAKTGSSHFGSRFEWLPDGTLIFSVGDGGNPPIEYEGELIREQAQKLNSHLGKIIRINDDGSIPADNPFAGRPDVAREIYSYGHRNVQGIIYDKSRERIIASEHGSKGGDELNQILAGQNYGWPLTTYSTEYDFEGTPISKTQSLPGTQDPIVVWTPTVAPSEVVFYDGDKYPDWNQNLFMAAMLLRENNSISAYTRAPAGAIFRIQTDDNGMVTNQEKLRLGERRIRSIGQSPDGYLYTMTNMTSPQNQSGENAGELVRIEK